MRYGSSTRPSHPGGVFETMVSSSAWLSPRSSRISSVATVTFMVHTRGSQPLVESQNAAISPPGSTTGASEYAYMVPEVPRLTVTFPGDVFPVPMAPIMLSPPPAETSTSSPRPSSEAIL